VKRRHSKSSSKKKEGVEKNAWGEKRGRNFKKNPAGTTEEQSRSLKIFPYAEKERIKKPFQKEGQERRNHRGTTPKEKKEIMEEHEPGSTSAKRRVGKRRRSTEKKRTRRRKVWTGEAEEGEWGWSGARSRSSKKARFKALKKKEGFRGKKR